MQADAEVAPPEFDLFSSQVLDADGDGREDLVDRAGYLRFPQRADAAREFVPFAEPLPSPYLTIADVDGDGTADLIPDIYASSSSSSGGAQVALLGRAANAGLLWQIQDGNGKLINISYAAGDGLVDFGDAPQEDRTYTVGSCVNDLNTTCLKSIGALVSSHTERQVRFSENDVPMFKDGPTFEYRYSGARIGLRGRGWYGFGQRSIELPGMWRSLMSYHNDDYFYAGRLRSAMKLTSGSAATAVTRAVSGFRDVTDLHWEKVPRPDLPAGGFPALAQVIRVRNEIVAGIDRALTRSETAHYVDGYGSETGRVSVTMAGERLVSTVTQVNTVENDATTWLLGRVTDALIEDVREGASNSVRKHYEYYPNTHLIRVNETQGSADAPGQPREGYEDEFLRQVLTRDAIGNVTLSCASVAEQAGPCSQSSSTRCSTIEAFDQDRIYPEAVRDAEGLLTTVKYSERDGQVWWVQDANGITSATYRDGFGRPRRVITPSSEGTLSYFSAQKGSVEEVPTGLDSGAIWPASGVVSNFKGQGTTRVIADAFGRTVATSTAGFARVGNSEVFTTTTYDQLGRVTSRSLPHHVNDQSQGKIEYEYDGSGRLHSASLPDGSITYQYYPTRHSVVAEHLDWFDDTSAGERAITATVVQSPRQDLESAILSVQVTDARGNPVRQVEVDPTLPEEVVTEYRYGAGDVVRQIDAELGVTTIEADSLGRPTLLTDPTLGQVRKRFNGFGELIETEDAEGSFVRSCFDRDGREREAYDVSDPSAAAPLLAKYVYGTPTAAANQAGRLIGAFRRAKPTSGSSSNAGHWTRYYYQAPGSVVNRGLPSAIEYGLAGTSDDTESGQRFRVEMSYRVDVPWRVDVLHYPSQGGAFGLRYGYDSFSGAVSSVSPEAGGAALWQLTEAEQGLRPKREVFGNGLVTTRDYYSLSDGTSDCQGQPNSSCMPGGLRAIRTAMPGSGQDMDVATYRYDRHGNVATFTHSGQETNTRTHAYRYDGLDRLAAHAESGTGLPPGGFSEAFTYDRAGNLQTQAGLTYTYDDPSHPYQVTQFGDTEYFYNDNGNQRRREGSSIPGGVQFIEYDTWSMPWRISGDDGAPSTELEYGGDGGRLIKRQLSGGASPLPRDLTVDIGELYQQVTTYAPGTTTIEQRVHKYRVYAGGKQVAQVSRTEVSGTFVGSETHYLHEDQLGSTTLITNDDGSIAERREYSPFGASQTATGLAAGGILSGFAGLEHDADLGLVNMRGRLYDPKLGRFISADPYVMNPMLSQGLNRYSYVRNNPINLADPSGYDPGHGQYGGGLGAGAGSQGTGYQDSGSHAVYFGPAGYSAPPNLGPSGLKDPLVSGQRS